MKKYIFITPRIDGMGGAQMYLYAKYKTLSEQGWDVSLIHASCKPSILPIFKDLNDAIEEIALQTSYFTKRIVNKVIDHIVKTYFTQEYDEIIIESTCIEQCTWAELLAERVKGKHLIYLLQEKNELSYNIVDFFLFKQNRGELAGIRQSMISSMFEPYMPFKEEEAHELVAYGCAHTVYDVEHPILEEIKELNVDYIIGSVGRLDKPFVKPSLDSVKRYIEQQKDKKFGLVLLGGSNNQDDITAIKALFSDADNCKLLISGFLFPLPKKAFSMIDVFFGTAGSANVAKFEGSISISIDACDYMPIGILGQTTTNSLSRGTDEPPLDLCELLDDVLVKKKYSRTEAMSLTDPDYTLHFDFLAKSEKKKEYFDVFSIKNTELYSQLAKCFVSIFGARRYMALSDLKYKLRK